MRPRIFVGSSREAIDVCRVVQLELADDFDVTVWDQDVFRLSYGAVDSLLDALDSSDAGVFVLRPDDLTSSRGELDPTVRDNVIFELGMFIGRLGRDRTFMLTPSASLVRLPSDLLGITSAGYDTSRISGGQKRAAVGPACTKIRERLTSLQLRVVEEPTSRVRLDRAMRHMSRDLESLLGGQVLRSSAVDGDSKAHASTQLGRITVHLELGRIQDYQSDDPRSVIALPANEYFDDECIRDTNSSLGAFVQHHFNGNVDEFLRQVRAELVGLPCQRVPRAERRIEDSFGIGQAIFLGELLPVHRVILVSATTERVGIGLRAEPHFLYAALQGVVETMNARRLDSLTMPVFGSGHGGMPLIVALLFNLLALRSIFRDDVGCHIRQVRIVIYEGSAAGITDTVLQDVISRVMPSN
jgi:hypothetical protein